MMAQPTTGESIARVLPDLPVWQQLQVLRALAKSNDWLGTDAGEFLTQACDSYDEVLREEAEREDAGAFLFLRQPYGMTPSQGFGA